MGAYTIHVVGESFANFDGSDRQREIARCRIGEAVQLVREPDNRHDANCVQVLSSRGVQIGNIGRDNAEWIAERMDNGGHVSAVIDGIADGGAGLLGVVLTLSTDDQNPASTFRRCPRCAEEVKATAKVCRHCGYKFNISDEMPTAFGLKLQSDQRVIQIIASIVVALFLIWFAIVQIVKT